MEDGPGTAALDADDDAALDALAQREAEEELLALWSSVEKDKRAVMERQRAFRRQRRGASLRPPPAGSRTSSASTRRLGRPALDSIPEGSEEAPLLAVSRSDVAAPMPHQCNGGLQGSCPAPHQPAASYAGSAIGSGERAAGDEATRAAVAAVAAAAVAAAAGNPLRDGVARRSLSIRGAGGGDGHGDVAAANGAAARNAAAAQRADAGAEAGASAASHSRASPHNHRAGGSHSRARLLPLASRGRNDGYSRLAASGPAADAPPPPPAPPHAPDSPSQGPPAHEPGEEPTFAHTLWAMLLDVAGVAYGPEQRTLFLAFGLAFFDQATATTAIINYAPSMLAQLHAGVATDHAMLYTVAIGAAKALGVAIAFMTVDKYGRRPLLIGGGLACGATLALATAAAAGGALALFLSSLCLFIFAFSLSWAGLYWVVVSELFSMGAKSPATSAATALLFLTGAFTNLVFLSLVEFMGAYAFLVFAALSVAAAGYVWRFLPETKGKTLSEIQSMMVQLAAASGPLGRSGRGAARPGPGAKKKRNSDAGDRSAAACGGEEEVEEEVEEGDGGAGAAAARNCPGGGGDGRDSDRGPHGGRGPAGAPHGASVEMAASSSSSSSSNPGGGGSSSNGVPAGGGGDGRGTSAPPPGRPQRH